jgi:hypothetical protein
MGLSGPFPSDTFRWAVWTVAGYSLRIPLRVPGIFVPNTIYILNLSLPL